MVDIIVGLIPPVQNNQSNSDQERRSLPKKKIIREKRKNKADRRLSVREGIVVTLSTQIERRKTPDRRESSS